MAQTEEAIISDNVKGPTKNYEVELDDGLWIMKSNITAKKQSYCHKNK